MTTPAIADCGDSALRITSAAATPDERWREVHRIAAAVDAAGITGVLGTIATYDAVLIEFDCATVAHHDIRAAVSELDTKTFGAARLPRRFEIPVVYGGEHGPDLAVVATLLDVSEADVIARHCARPLTMRCYGSPGGAPMLDGPDFGLPIPRRASPRSSVPAGAVAVAGHQAVVSARPAPGGWQVLGRTPVTLVDIASDPISAYAPGDTFQFVPISAAEWGDHHEL
ncbi:5-oxoprolinase subunit B family protein [Rhodococcoides fascians]|uniref:5-oxoprolinase subunit B family protein n=1 Tax=Rhodococcoides fascians TaxID=1828 RepID=UPI00050C7CC8|nr:carboxyltransferase domain-containing protein [Rhodococcus fascians]